MQTLNRRRDINYSWVVCTCGGIPVESIEEVFRSYRHFDLKSHLMKLPLPQFTADQPLKDCHALVDCQWWINCFLHMLCPQFPWHIRVRARISVSVKACRQANSNNLKLSGSESVIRTGSCRQHHAQENIRALAVVAGNPDNTPVQNQWPATDHRKLKKKKKKDKLN